MRMVRKVVIIMVLGLLVLGAAGDLIVAAGDPANLQQLRVNTADFFWLQTLTYDWSISKAASPESVTIPSGESATIDYTLDVSRDLASTENVYGVSGQVCVKNQNNADPTEGLEVTVILRYQVPGGGQTILATALADISANPVLDGGEEACYPYTIYFQPVEGAKYQVSAEASITNGGGANSGQDPKDLDLPLSPVITEVDEAASAEGVVTCPDGFSCAPSAASWNFTGTDVAQYTVDVANVSAPCDTYVTLDNTATLTEGDTGQQSSDSASVSIYTGLCPGGCTLTHGYWKTHAGFTGRNADRVTDKLPIWLGTAGGAKSVQVTTAAQAVTILSTMGSNGINKLYAQLLAAKLNIAKGADGSAVASTISAADAFLATKNAADWSSLSKTNQQLVLGWMSTLDSYNNGLIGPGHCG